MVNGVYGVGFTSPFWDFLILSLSCIFYIGKRSLIHRPVFKSSTLNLAYYLKKIHLPENTLPQVEELWQLACHNSFYRSNKQECK
jgi:hypothetical protein